MCTLDSNSISPAYFLWVQLHLSDVCMMCRFDDLSPTIGVDFRMKFIDMNSQRIKLTIWDTAGQVIPVSRLKWRTTSVCIVRNLGDRAGALQNSYEQLLPWRPCMALNTRQTRHYTTCWN